MGSIETYLRDNWWIKMTPPVHMPFVGHTVPYEVHVHLMRAKENVGQSPYLTTADRETWPAVYAEALRLAVDQGL